MVNNKSVVKLELFVRLLKVKGVDGSNQFSLSTTIKTIDRFSKNFIEFIQCDDYHWKAKKQPKSFKSQTLVFPSYNILLSKEKHFGMLYKPNKINI